MDDLVTIPNAVAHLFTLTEPDHDTLRSLPRRGILHEARRARSIVHSTTTRLEPSQLVELAPRLAVMVIEPDALRRVELSRALLQRDCDVISCTSPAEAEEHLREPSGSDLDAIVVDIELSGAAAVVRLLRERSEKAALVCWTRASEAIVAPSIRQTGAILNGVVPRSRTGREVAELVRCLALRG